MDKIALTGEIIVVDNKSSDKTAEIAQEHGVKVVFEPVRQIARARNCGAKHSRGNYLVFLDADTKLSHELLEEALELLDSRLYCGGGTLVDFDSDLPYLATKLVKLWNWISKKGKLAAGSFIFCLSQSFRDIGGFDETVYAGEEIFLSRKLKEWGKENNKLFTIIDKRSVITSGRKFYWYSSAQILLLLLVFTVFPVAFRYQSLCRFWYARPDS
jgi:glycosyltransferase involved in cell wall biosynthesis